MADAPAAKPRKTLTTAERKLWEALKRLEVWGAHFRKQAPKGGGVVDFISDDAKLVIEIDVEEHADERQARYNEARSELLSRSGYRFLRLWEKDVLRDLAKVVATVIAALREQQPLEAGGQGEAAPQDRPSRSVKQVSAAGARWSRRCRAVGLG